MSKLGGNRNFGFGKQLGYAGHNALTTSYQGHFATVAAHSARWNRFSEFCKSIGVKDARNIKQETLKSYANHLRQQFIEGDISLRYGHNLLSTANVVLAALRGDKSIKVSPSQELGKRIQVRTVSPKSLEEKKLKDAIAELRASGHDRAAAVLDLARTFGLRLKETSLLNLREAISQAERHGSINVVDGTKGGRGREVDRWVPATQAGLSALKAAIAAASPSKNLIPAGHTYAQFFDYVHRTIGPVFQHHDLGTVHDLRATYACERYQQITGVDAPVVAGRRQASKPVDRSARDTISHELGHGRRDIAAAYLGSAR